MQCNSMAVFKTIIKTTLIAAVVISANEGFNECPGHQETSCESLRAPAGFTYTYRLRQSIACSGDCEQGWYFKNGTLIVDPCESNREERLPIVTDVTLESLKLSVCASLQWQIECVEPEVKNCYINFTVADSAEHTQDEDSQAGFPGWEIVFIVIGTITLALTAAACIFIIVKRCNRHGVV